MADETVERVMGLATDHAEAYARIVRTSDYDIDLLRRASERDDTYAALRAEVERLAAIEAAARRLDAAVRRRDRAIEAWGSAGPGNEVVSVMIDGTETTVEDADAAVGACWAILSAALARREGSA